MNSQAFRRLAVWLFFLFCCVLPRSIQSQVNPIQRVLVLYEVDAHYPAISIIDQGISDTLRNLPHEIEIYREYLDTALFPDPTTQREIREWYTRKYRDRRPDLIIAVGPSAIEFMIAAHKAFFRDVPVVFCLSSEKAAGRAKLEPYFTGMWEEPEPTKTLEAALRLNPGTKHVFLVGGTSPYDKLIEVLYRERLRDYESKLDFGYLTDLPMPELLDRLRHLPDHSVVLHLGILRDAAGKQFMDATEAGPMVVQAANAPVFTFSNLNMGHGEAGGYLLNLAEEGKFAAATALRILNGEKPQDIPIVRNVNVYMFDWAVLKRWGMNERNLPLGSIVLNRQPTAWESYKWYVIGGISLILIEGILIGGLLWHRARRQKLESELHMAHDRVRLAVEAGRSVGWEWDTTTGRNEWFGDLQTMFGISSHHYSAQLGDFRQRVHPEDRGFVWQAMSDAREKRKAFIAEFRLTRNDGAIRWVTATGKFYYQNGGRAERMLGMATDITDRKMADETRFKHAAIVEPSDDAIISKTLDGFIVSWNMGAEQIYGFTAHEAIGKPITILVPPELWDEEKNILEKLSAGEHIRHYETVRVTKTGEQINVSLTISPIRDSKNEIVGVSSISRDITKQKLAEQALANMPRKLIETQEQERSRIGRELHDDINQRLALLAVELDQWGYGTPLDQNLQKHLKHAKQQITDIARDVQALSHQLHSSKLEYLGLVTAAKSLCKEMAQKHNVRIDFKQDGVPRGLPAEISLGLFRVIQEGLQNAIKHSGADRFAVQLHV